MLRNYSYQIEQPLRFQGQYEDLETKLYYNRHRYYDPQAARYLVQDPVGLSGGNNFYQYAPNSTGWIDPLGLSRFKRTSYQAPCRGTGINYTVYQQQIDWDMEVNGKTNLQRASQGGAPYIMKDGRAQPLELHHSRQNALGPIFELTRPTHRLGKNRGRQALHPYGNEKHPDFPVDRDNFDVDRDQYWRDRAKAEKRKRSEGACFV